MPVTPNLRIRAALPAIVPAFLLAAVAFAGPATPAPSAAPPATGGKRADTLAAAFGRVANEKSGAVLVYAHGSDWNPAGETLLKRVVNDPAFAAGLPAGVVLVDVDLPEEGARKRVRQLMAKLPAATGAGTTAVSGKNGTLYARKPDGSWLADEKTNPDKEVVDIRFTTGPRAARSLRLGFLADPSMPEGKCGRAGNANCAVNEIELLDAKGNPLPLRLALADYEERSGDEDRAASRLVDGDKEPSGRAWSLHGSDLKDQHVLLVPEADLPAGAAFTLRLHCVAPWNRHTPGRLRLDPLPAGSWDAELTTVAKAVQLEAANRAVKLDTTNLPALYLYGADKRRFAAITPLRADATAAQLTGLVRAALARQGEGEALLAKAKAAASPAERVELLAKAALVLDGEARKGAIAELRKTDANSPWLWRLDFNLGEVGKEQDRLLKEKGEQAALDYLDGVLASPRASKLTASQRQEILLRQVRIVRKWKGHEDLRWGLFERIAKEDPTTHFGLGAQGQINYHGRGIATIAYGWWPKHVKQGANRLLIQEGVALNLPQPGLYRLTLSTRNGSKDAAVFRGAAFVLADGRELSAVVCDKRMDNDKNKSASCNLTLPEGTDPAKVLLRVDIELAGGDHSCTIGLVPTLPEEGPRGWQK